MTTPCLGLCCRPWFGSMSGWEGYVQFGDATDPTLLITSPSSGAAVSGFVPLSISWRDVLPAGGGGTVQTELLVDGEVFCGFHASDETGDTTVNSNELSNGQHEVTAVAIDPEGSETVQQRRMA